MKSEHGPHAVVERRTVEALAQGVVDRVLEVYRPEYVEKAAREEPESLLGLVVRLQVALERGQEPPPSEAPRSRSWAYLFGGL